MGSLEPMEPAAAVACAGKSAVASMVGDGQRTPSRRLEASVPTLALTS